MMTAGGQLPVESCVCRSGAGATLRIMQITYLGRKTKINIGSSRGHIHGLPLGLAAKHLRGPLLWNYLMVVHLGEKNHCFFLKIS